MSNPEAKEKHSKRIHQKQVAAHHNADIARSHGIDVKPWEEHLYLESSHMSCGNPNCVMCGNPRKLMGEITIQEKRITQEKLWSE